MIHGLSAASERAPISRFTLRFLDPAIEAAYWRHQFDAHRALLRFTTVFFLVGFALFGVIDLELFREVHVQMWWVRYGFGVPAAAVAVAFVWWPPLANRFSRQHFPSVLGLMLLSCLVCLAAMAWILAGLHHALMPLFFGLMYMVVLQVVVLVVRVQFVLGAPLVVGALLAVLLLALFADGTALELASIGSLGALAGLVGLSGLYLFERASRAQFDSARRLEIEHRRGEELLLNILPAQTVARLRRDGQRIADMVDDAAVLFADIVGFTQMAASLPPDRIVALLDRVFSAFDRFVEEVGAEKIKTIGDAYMAAAGVPDVHADAATAIARLALRMRDHVEQMEPVDGHKLSVRIGLDCGPAVAGIIGRRRFVYDLWGDTVNTAARMESHGVPGRIQVTDGLRARLGDRFAFTDRGEVEVKGKGTLHTWFLDGEAG